MRCCLAALAAVSVFLSGACRADSNEAVFQPRAFVNWVFGGGGSQYLFQAGLQLRPSSSVAGPVASWLDVRVIPQGVSLDVAGLPVARSVLLRDVADGSAISGTDVAKPWYENGWVLGAGALGVAALAVAVGGGGGSSGSGDTSTNKNSNNLQGNCAQAGGTTVGVGGGSCPVSAP